MNESNYFLPTNYSARLNNSFFDDTPYKDEYQDDVYLYAKNILVKDNLTTILDIGTGSGYKLVKYFNEFDTLGVDLEPTLSFLKKNYPNNNWCSFEDINSTKTFDIIICSDVIEHIPNPTEFLYLINKLNFNGLILSTPNKTNMYGYEHIGPPENGAHVREWNPTEFNNYISSIFNVKDHYMPVNSNTQLIFCEKK